MASKSSGGQRKHGRCLRKNSKKQYKAHDRRTKNKLRRIQQSNGERAVLSYKKNKSADFPTRQGKGRVNSRGFKHIQVGGEYRFVKA